MSLTCGCDVDWYPEPGDWYWISTAKDYAPLPFKRKRKCCSCGKPIDVGALAVEHPRARVPEHDVAINIYGDDGEIPIASDWMCEKCGDLFFSLEAIGYWVNPREVMYDLLNEHTDAQTVSINGFGLLEGDLTSNE